MLIEVCASHLSHLPYNFNCLTYNRRHLAAAATASYPSGPLLLFNWIRFAMQFNAFAGAKNMCSAFMPLLKWYYQQFFWWRQMICRTLYRAACLINAKCQSNAWTLLAQREVYSALGQLVRASLSLTDCHWKLAHLATKRKAKATAKSKPLARHVNELLHAHKSRMRQSICGYS